MKWQHNFENGDWMEIESSELGLCLRKRTSTTGDRSPLVLYFKPQSWKDLEGMTEAFDAALDHMEKRMEAE